MLRARLVDDCTHTRRLLVNWTVAADFDLDHGARILPTFPTGTGLQDRAAWFPPSQRQLLGPRE